MRIEKAHRSLGARLRSRRAEIEQALLTRVYGIADPAAVGDPQYIDGLRASLTAAVDYALEALELSQRPAAIPLVLRSQARLAAQYDITLDVILRRYVAGFTLLADFLLEEASAMGVSLRAGDLRLLLRSQASLLDHLLNALSEEYRRAREEIRADSSQGRRLDQVKRLLAGELLDVPHLEYHLDAWHVGLVAVGAEAMPCVRRMATALDRMLLMVQPEDNTAWVWLGGREPPDIDALVTGVSAEAPSQVQCAIGEPGEGLAGWRLTHRQAAAAAAVAIRGDAAAVRYTEVALLATALQDDLLAVSLRQAYLVPLDEERDGGVALRKTLRAYLATGGSLSSAATLLGVSRRTVGNRLAKVEQKLGRPLHAALPEIETALRMEDLGTTESLPN